MVAAVSADEVYTYVCTCPAGTAQAAPVTIELDMPDRTVLAIRARIPPGWHGDVGFALGSAGANIIPGYHGAPWLVGDNEWFDWNLTRLIDSGAWEVTMYNTGIYDHSLYLTFTVTVPPTDPAAASATDGIIAALSAPATAPPAAPATTITPAATVTATPDLATAGPTANPFG